MKHLNIFVFPFVFLYFLLICILQFTFEQCTKDGESVHHYDLPRYMDWMRRCRGSVSPAFSHFCLGKHLSTRTRTANLHIPKGKILVKFALYILFVDKFKFIVQFNSKRESMELQILSLSLLILILPKYAKLYTSLLIQIGRYDRSAE